MQLHRHISREGTDQGNETISKEEKLLIENFPICVWGKDFALTGLNNFFVLYFHSFSFITKAPECYFPPPPTFADFVSRIHLQNV